VLHPKNYQVNETWITFQLNDAPVMTDRDGDFNVIALIDAASCFILDIGYVSTDALEMSQSEAERLLHAGYSHKKQYPKELLIPSHLTTNVLGEQAERRGINVVRVPEEQLHVLIGEARESFQEHISRNRVQ
jgi:hypothetical protein